MNGIGGIGKRVAGLVGVDHDADFALRIELDGAVPVAGGPDEAQRRQEGGQIVLLVLGCGEFDEFDTTRLDTIRHDGNVDRDIRLQPADTIHQVDERAVPVFGKALAEPPRNWSLKISSDRGPL